jgi:AraC-like DNA-binding protein
MGESAADRLTCDVWDLDARHDSHAADAYRRACAHLFAITLLVPDAEFHNRLEGYDFGGAVFARCQGVPQRFTRDRTHIAGDPSDTVQVIIDLEGATWSGKYSDRVADQTLGSVRIVDMALPFEFTTTTAYTTLNLVLPRPALGTAGDLDLHGLILSEEEPGGQLIVTHLRTLWANVPRLSRLEARAAMDATVALLRGAIAFKASEPGRDRRLGRKTMLAAARLYIDKHLGDAALSPDVLRAELGISRSVLYQLFEPLGGVGTFIRTRRLDHAFDAIVRDEAERMTLVEIGYAHGFRSDAHFSRVFRARFGIAPGQLRRLRERALEDSLSVVQRPDDVWTWLKGL